MHTELFEGTKLDCKVLMHFAYFLEVPQGSHAGHMHLTRPYWRNKTYLELVTACKKMDNLRVKLFDRPNITLFIGNIINH